MQISKHLNFSATSGFTKTNNRSELQQPQGPTAAFSAQMVSATDSVKFSSYLKPIQPAKNQQQGFWKGVGTWFKKLPRRIIQNVLSAPVRVVSYLNPKGYKNGWQKVKRLHQSIQNNDRKGAHYFGEALGLGLDVFNIVATLGLVVPFMMVYPDVIIGSNYISTFLEGIQEPWTRKFFDWTCRTLNTSKWDYDDSHLLGKNSVYKG